jgi:arabinoxylan arabinofuranohydrolase
MSARSGFALLAVPLAVLSCGERASSGDETGGAGGGAGQSAGGSSGGPAGGTSGSPMGGGAGVSASGASGGAAGGGAAGATSGSGGMPSGGTAGAGGDAAASGSGGIAGVAGVAGTPPGGSAGTSGSGGAPPGQLNGFARNPIVSHVFTADPSAHVFEGRVYIYASHDLDTQAAYDMNDYHVFSSDDLVNWQDHGVALDAADITWADKLYAPDAAYSEVTGKYYLYFPNDGSAIGVAVSDSPAGPFVDAIGAPLINNSTPGVEDVNWIFDPTCFIDDDGQVYLYFGGGMPDTGDNARVIRLNADMVSLADTSATTIVAPDFFEASYLHKRGDKYYFSYSTSFANHPAAIDYMVSDSPMTGFEYVGTILPSPAGNNEDNNHHSMLEYQGSWYIFYHNRLIANRDGFTNFQRSITLDHMSYDDAGNIVPVPAERGVVAQLKSLDALTRIEAETIADQRGIEVDFVEDAGVRAGVMVTELADGDWIGYSQLDFGTGAESFHARVASGAAAAGNIEVHLDGCDLFTEAPGTVIGTCSVNATGGFQTWSDVECPIAPTAGIHDICLVFKGASDPLFNVDYFRFE